MAPTFDPRSAEPEDLVSPGTAERFVRVVDHAVLTVDDQCRSCRLCVQRPVLAAVEKGGDTVSLEPAPQFHVLVTRAETTVAAFRPPSQNVGSRLSVPKLPKT